MKREVNPSFYAALADAGRKTTPQELAKKGVRKLRTYRLSEISFLIERALNKTLVERTLSPLAAEEMAELSEAAEREFKKQLGSLEELRASRGALEMHRDSVQRELKALRSLVDRKRGASTTASDLRHLLIEIHGAIKPLSEQTKSPAWLVKDVVTDLHALFEARIAASLEMERTGFEGEIENLERRIKKLVASIEQMEQALDRLARTKDLETGIASIYRTVQGLSSDESELDQKRLMMAALFAANVELRERIDVASGA